MANRESEQDLAYVMKVSKGGLKPLFFVRDLTGSVFFCFFCSVKCYICVNISIMHLSNKDISDSIAFYEDERLRLTGKLKHVESMLRKLNGENIDSQSGVLLTRTGSKAKKRGPKSVWGKFVLEQLEVTDRPMTYRELMDIAMESKGLDKSKFANVRASILNSAFRLRAISGKITTIGEAGKKEKFIVLSDWLNEEGKLPSKHIKWLNEEMGFKPDPVDMSSIPKPKYEEDLR